MTINSGTLILLSMLAGVGLINIITAIMPLM